MPQDCRRLLESEFAEHAEVLARTREAVREPFQALLTACRQSLSAGGKILFCGNGGSAGDAQHLAAELVCRYKVNRRALAAIALTTDSSILTATANDFSYDQVFSRQIEALARPNDLLIAISTSGRSPSIIAALDAAKAAGAVAAGFTGRDGGLMVGRADPLIIVPSEITARIQEMHSLLGHILCDALEQSIL
ncbi:MAG TPA: SIS domain-containing protein [Rhodospirillaceae bacterium]|nr:SIS domain-containing protein [Rhodospirillaceae bacterium]